MNVPRRKAGLFSAQFGRVMRESLRDQRLIERSLEPEPAPKMSRPELPVFLRKILGEGASEPAIPRYKLDRAIVDGLRFGCLTPLAQHTRVGTLSNGRRVLAYRTRCACGREAWLTARMIFTRWSVAAGCGHSDCLYSQSMISWSDPVKAVRTQLEKLARLAPTELANEWGGLAFTEFVPVADTAMAAELVAASIPLPDREEGRFWMRRKVKWMPYGPDNVEWRAGIDDPFLHGLFASTAVGHASDLEIASVFGVDVELVRRLMAQGLSDDALVDALLDFTAKDNDRERPKGTGHD